MFEEQLQALRQEIDAYDNQILSLLQHRTAVVEKVGRLKQKTGQKAFMRPGREAQIIRRLLTQHQGAMQPRVLVQLWREIMMASLQIEAPFKVAVYAPHGDFAHWRRARNHFGEVTTLLPYPAPLACLDALAAGDALLAVMPDVTNDPWWTALAAPTYQDINFIFKLPFVAQGPQQEISYAVGNMPFEASGADRRLWLVAPGTKTIGTILAKESTAWLVEADHAAPAIRPVGGYAVPVVV